MGERKLEAANSGFSQNLVQLEHMPLSIILITHLSSVTLHIYIHRLTV